MIIRAYSDLHGFLPNIDPCDALLIAGDICPIDGAYGDHTPKTQARWLKEVFNPWCHAQPAEHIVLIGGNHDAVLDPAYNLSHAYELGEKVTYLLDSSTEIPNGGPSIFGQPWIPNLKQWPFYKTGHQLKRLAEAIPSAHDLWLLHSPPMSFEPGFTLDLTLGSEHVGNPWTTPIIEERGPQLIVCGHIHEGFGIDQIAATNVANCAFVDRHYTPHHRHFEIEWDEDEHAVTRVQQVLAHPTPELWWNWADTS